MGLGQENPIADPQGGGLGGSLQPFTEIRGEGCSTKFILSSHGRWERQEGPEARPGLHCPLSCPTWPTGGVLSRP
eukprot:scaffold10043_cov27-Tisochrysis_lutea.AAC.5